MFNNKVNKYFISLGLCLAMIGCKAPDLKLAASSAVLPEVFTSSKDTATIATVQWHNFFKDKNLTDLIDVALQNNHDCSVRPHQLNP